MPTLLFGRWSLEVTITTVDQSALPGLGLSAYWRVTNTNSGPVLAERPGYRATRSWPDGATPQEWYDFNRLLDGLYRNAGVPEHMLPLSDLWHIPPSETERRELAKQELFAKRPDLNTFARRTFG